MLVWCMNRRSWLLIVFTWFLGNASVYFIAPGLPALVNAFHTTPRMAQLTITTLLAGKAFSMLLWGWLSKRLGRRIIFILGIVLYTGSNVLAAFSINMTMLLIARVLQGFAVGSTLLMGRVMINDTQNEQQATRQFGFLFSLAGVFICFLPLLGSGINAYAGWSSAFLVMAAYGFVLLFFCGGLMETGREHRQDSSLLESAAQVFGNALFVRYLVISALMMAGESAFNTSSSFILMKEANYGLAAYGGMKTAMAITHVLGTLTCALLTGYFNSSSLVGLGLYFFAAASGSMWMFHALELPIEFTFVMPMMLYYFGTGFIVASSTAAAVRPFPNHMAIALAFSLFCQFMLSAVASLVSSLLAIERAEHFMILIPVITALGVMIWFRAKTDIIFVAE